MGCMRITEKEELWLLRSRKLKALPAKARSGFAWDDATREQSERRRDTSLAPL